MRLSFVVLWGNERQTVCNADDEYDPSPHKSFSDRSTRSWKFYARSMLCSHSWTMQVDFLDAFIHAHLCIPSRKKNKPKSHGQNAAFLLLTHAHQHSIHFIILHIQEEHTDTIRLTMQEHMMLGAAFWYWTFTNFCVSVWLAAWHAYCILAALHTIAHNHIQLDVLAKEWADNFQTYTWSENKSQFIFLYIILLRCKCAWWSWIVFGAHTQQNCEYMSEFTNNLRVYDDTFVCVRWIECMQIVCCCSEIGVFTAYCYSPLIRPYDVMMWYGIIVWNNACCCNAMNRETISTKGFHINSLIYAILIVYFYFTAFIFALLRAN